VKRVFVAQIFNLLYRGFLIRKGIAGLAPNDKMTLGRMQFAATRQSATLRYDICTHS
jgi:hypothetical protein